MVAKAREDCENRTPGVRLVIAMDRQRRIPKFEIEDVNGPERGDPKDLEANGRGSAGEGRKEGNEGD